VSKFLSPKTVMPGYGISKTADKIANPVGAFVPKSGDDFTPTYQKGWLDTSSNGTPDTPKVPGYNVWADPDITKRGWGWGMGADGALHTGVVGGGPAGSIWGPPGTTTGGLNGYGPPAPGNTGSTGNSGQGGTNTGAQPGIDPKAMGNQFFQGFNGAQGGAMNKLVQGMRSMVMPGAHTPGGMGAAAPGLSGQMPPATPQGMPQTSPQQFNPQQYLALAQQMRAGQSPQGPTTI
jgi:hypothetical protein